MSDQSWPATNLGELFTIHTDGVTPNTSPNTEFHHHSLPAWDELGGPVVEKGSSIESNKTKVTKPCVLVSKLNPRKPRVSVIEVVADEEHHCASTEFVCLVPKHEESLNFWGHFFANKSFSDNLDRIAIGSTNSHKRYSPKALLSQKIELPSVPERRLIARILDTLDTQIEKTEALIAKLEKVKEGLLHDLLTRGIDENGQLRPSPEQAPELYKESPLGLIPKEWEAQELCALGVFNNGLNKPKEAFGSGTRFINISDVYPDYLVPDTLARVQVTRTELETYSAEFGDIFIDRSSVKLEGVGYPTVFEGADEPVVYSGFIIRFRLNEKSRTLPRFLCCQMRSEAFRSEVFKVATKSANVNINQVALSTLIAVIPSTEEQHKIVLREWTLDTRLQVEREKKERLHRIKAGLMDDLLAGRIRVTPLLKQA